MKMVPILAPGKLDPTELLLGNLPFVSPDPSTMSRSLPRDSVPATGFLSAQSFSAKYELSAMLAASPGASSRSAVGVSV